MRVLVADDSSLNREVATRLLEAHGHEVVAVTTGAEAAAAALTQPFDVVLMDLEMPGMDGLEATAAIRAGEKQRTRIVAMTGHRDPEIRQRCLDAGMDACIVKPVSPDVLAAAVAGDEPDFSDAIAALGGNAELFGRMAAAFRDETPRLLAQVRAALDGDDAETARRAAHTLVGSLRYFDAPTAAGAAEALQAAIRAGDGEAACGLLRSVEEECARLLQRLARFGGGIG